MNGHLKLLGTLLGPAIVAPVLIAAASWAFGDPSSAPLTGLSLFYLAMLVLFYPLTTVGLMSHFPKVSLDQRSVASLAVQNLMIGLVFGAFMVLFSHFISPDATVTLQARAGSFVFMAAIFGGGMFLMSYFTRRSLLARQSAEHT